MNKGFSLLEIIVSIAIAAILLTIITTSFRTAQVRKTQDGITQSILASLEEQKANSQAGKGGSSYGVKFNSNEFITFKGISYSESSVDNKTFPVDSKFQISETISNANNIIYFSKLNGNSNEVATITISHISNEVTPQNLIIETSGAISMVE